MILSGAAVRVTRIRAVSYEISALNADVSETTIRPHDDPMVGSESNGSEYQEYFLGVKAAGA